MRKSFGYSCILESATGQSNLARHSIVAFDPFCVLTVENGRIKVEDRRNSNILFLEKQHEDPLQVIRRIVNSRPTDNTQFRFAGGAVGYISYDAISYWEKKLADEKKNQPAEFPDMQFGFYDEGIIYDHQINKAYYFFSDSGKDRQREIEEIVTKEPIATQTKSSHAGEFSFSGIRTTIKQEAFETSVKKAKEYIRNGDIFQVVLSKRYKFNFKGDLLRFYSELRKLNPSPYMYFLGMGETSIVGSSPEMLVRVERGIVETFPIAGTRRTTQDKIQNEKLKQELLSDPKERAEHVMLVDLARNDVGKISEYGTVSVPEFMQVKQFSHVQHIVSHVTGKLKEEFNSFDALRSLFPAGTVSGAPKIRAMEIIDELETERRGPYAGAVGYFSFNGNMDSAITIRTLVARGDEASIQAGAGIVADSDPRNEWFETEHKSRALFNALELSVKNKEQEE